MNNLTKSEIIDHINDERRETNSSFISAAMALRWMNQCNRKIISKPEVKTVPDTQTINFTGSGDYTHNTDFKGPISLYSGSAAASVIIEFGYLPPDEFNLLRYGYAYTFKVKGKISIFAPDTSSLPTTTLTLDYWSKNIILDADGVTKKSKWENDGDKSRLAPEFDDLWIEWASFRIKKREGKKDDAKEHFQLFDDMLVDLSEEGGVPKPRRPMRAFGHFMGGRGN